MNRGDIISVMPHHIKGYDWTIGQVGVILGPTHTENIDNRHLNVSARAKVKLPPVKEGWYVVSLTHSVAKGGYAYADLPEEFLSPHACTVNCPRHLSL